MTKHRHAEMIKAKADNMELVVFIKHNNETEWKLMKYHNFPEFGGTHEYYLCLPQHKEACSHWLNGGNAQTDRGCDNFVDVYPFSDYNGNWCDTLWYMLNDYASRIKPRKEKRQAAYNKDKGELYPVTAKVGTYLEDYMNDRGEIYHGHPWQFIEIEVEV